MDFEEKLYLPNPRESTNPISKLFFWWILPLFRKCYTKELEAKDLYSVLPEDRAELLSNQLSAAWDKELVRAKRKQCRPRFYRAIISVFGCEFVLSGISLGLYECVFRVFQTLCLKWLVESYSIENQYQENLDLKRYLYATGICFTMFIGILTNHPSLFWNSHIGMKMRAAASCLMYRKILRLSKAVNNQPSVGQLVNLLSNDVNKFDYGLFTLHFFVYAPIQTIVFTFLLWKEFGPACLAGTGIILSFVPLQYFVGKKLATCRAGIAGRTDNRGKILNEIILAIRVIKMYAWEKPFSNVIAQLRRLEVNILRKSAYLRGGLMCLNFSSSKLIAFGTFLAYVFLDDRNMLTANKVFFAVGTYNILRLTMISFFPGAAAAIGSLIVAMNRIEDLLMRDEQKISDNLHLNAIQDVSERPQIIMKRVCARWNDHKLTLDNLTMSLEGDQLVIICGSVGSGKTSLLHALIAELPISSGDCSVKGKITYAGQEPWVFCGNLRQNILFGSNFCEDRYKEILHLCSLDDDLRDLPYGDQTVVGERGLSLSGGQKARVNLARAIYQEADIYFMDDPLSAVDARVSRHIFEECIKKHLKGHLRILVTHQLQYLPQADHIIVLNDGKIIAQGTYAELISAGVDFVRLMSTETEDDSENLKEGAPTKTDKSPKSKNNGNEKPSEQQEAMAAGSIDPNIYWNYFKSANSFIGITIIIVSLIFTQTLFNSAEIWLTLWTNEEEQRALREIDDINTESSYLNLSRNSYIYVYAGITTAIAIFTCGRTLYFFGFCIRISVNIHNRMFSSLIRAPIKFFDENPSGRILNRFTRDLGTIDEMLPDTFYDAISIFCTTIGIMVVIVVANYYMIIPTTILLIIFGLLRKFYIHTARRVKRIESVARSPLFTHLAASLQGLTTIRAAKSQQILIHQFEGLQDFHGAAWYIYIAANRWFGIWLEMVTFLFLIVISIAFLLSTHTVAGNLGLAFSSALGMAGQLQWGMRQSAETENSMTSVERALEYCKVKPEAELESKKEKQPPSNWPTLGQIEFRNVGLTYDAVPILRDINFVISGNEKVGIVGRTGAGKSSLLVSLFRLTEPSGEILIDGLRINDIGLHDLRQRISIIPQDPVLFSGTVRYNLDPFEQFPDVELWEAIEQVDLKDEILSLDFKVQNGGSNFSVGQRQLLCLARAILRKNQIIVMDEATANIDPRTDMLIQQTIRTKFSSCTIIAIAHRLHSVMDYNRILVLENGSIKEYSHPHILLQNADGALTAMVNQTGKASSQLLRKIAAEAFLAGPNTSSVTSTFHAIQEETDSCNGSNSSEG